MCGLFSEKKEVEKEVWNLIKLQNFFFIFGSLEIVQKHKKEREK